jgi:hypothetical protein
MPQQDEIQYFRLIEDLARDIHGQLKAMAGRQPDKRPAGVANSCNGRAALFLAEVTDDLEHQRLEVRRYLEQQCVLVLPEASLPLGRAEFEAALDADLARSRVFVQLLVRCRAKGRRTCPTDMAGCSSIPRDGAERVSCNGAAPSWTSPASNGRGTASCWNSKRCTRAHSKPSRVRLRRR